MDEADKKIEELRIACRCLFIAVDEGPAKDVQVKAEAVINQLKECREENNDRIADFQDFACCISDALWGGELGWAHKDGLKKLCTAIRNKLKRCRQIEQRTKDACKEAVCKIMPTFPGWAVGVCKAIDSAEVKV